MTLTQIHLLLDKAYKKKGKFPDHIMAQSGMVGKEYGRIQEAAFKTKYEATNTT